MHQFNAQLLSSSFHFADTSLFRSNLLRFYFSGLGLSSIRFFTIRNKSAFHLLAFVSFFLLNLSKGINSYSQKKDRKPTENEFTGFIATVS